MRGRIWIVTLAALVSQPTLSAAANPQDSAHVRVLGIGTVKTPPDLATVTFAVRGEGDSADAAARALITRKAAIDNGIAQIGEVKTQEISGKLDIDAARSKECDGGSDDFNDKTRLSTGACAIKGYVASMPITLKLSVPGKAGTMVAQVSRLGAINASINGFDLSDRTVSKQRAVAAAMADGRAQAAAIAAASGQHLGRLLTVEDELTRDTQGSDEIVVLANRAPPPPAVMAPPLIIAIAPEPIETVTRLVLTFELLP
jgi:uncharacterized protein YggE